MRSDLTISPQTIRDSLQLALWQHSIHQPSQVWRKWRPVVQERLKHGLQTLKGEIYLRYFLLESRLRGVSYTLSTKTLRGHSYSLLLLVCVLPLLFLLRPERRIPQTIEPPIQTTSPRVIPLAKPSPFSERWGLLAEPVRPLPSQVEEKVVKVETIRVQPAGLPQESDIGIDPPVIREERRHVRPISRRASSDICTRHNRRKVVYYRGKYKYWRCVR
jgi:hypothetical protein